MFLNNEKSSLDYDWYHPRIRFVRVPSQSLDVLGQFRRISNEMATKAATKAGQSSLIDNDYIYMPVHELQIVNITSKFQDVGVLDEDIFLPALAQSSIRRVNQLA